MLVRSSNIFSSWKQESVSSRSLLITKFRKKLISRIDDLVDTGATAKIVRNMLPDAYFATVYAKPAGKPLVDAYVTEVSQDTWILFPWDSESQFVEPIAGK